MTSPPGSITRGEILHQAELWPTTVARVSAALASGLDVRGPAVITGAGSSAYAATAVAAAWPDSRAIPTTELLHDPHGGQPHGFAHDGLLVSLARSGDSPESLAVVELVQRLYPAVRHLAITCNERGRLASAPGVRTILLDPRTNDRSLAVTSSFTNIVLAGLSLGHLDALRDALPTICARVTTAQLSLDTLAAELARTGVSRVTVLAPPALVGAAREAALKVLEMSDGAIVAMPETVLGLRHGPMTFLTDDGIVLCFASADVRHRRYEEDLFLQLRAKGLGRIVAIAPAAFDPALVHHTVRAHAPELPDALRTPFEMVFPQLLALHLGLAVGLNPDEPSPRGVINRVVQGVRIHEA